MRSFLPFLAAVVLIVPTVSASPDLSDPELVNQILSGFKTPQLSPGERGTLSFTLQNPYENNITNVSLTASIYLYVSSEEKREVDENWSWTEPYFLEAGVGKRDYVWNFDSFPSGYENHVNLSVTIVTSRNSPHGGLLDQGSYLIRFELRFAYAEENVTSTHLMRSRGYFTDEQWEFATQPPLVDNDPNYTGAINLTHLGVDGILPDSSFGILEPFPIWVFYAITVVAGVFLVLALLFYLEENPGKWPWLARKWIRIRSKLRQARRLSKSKMGGSDRKKV